jgi:hypothetical protein
MRKTILYLIMIALWTATVWFGWWCGRLAPQRPAEKRLPGQGEIQRLLNELEPNEPITVDGVVGPATRAKWERVYYRRQAKRWDEVYGRPR